MGLLKQTSKIYYEGPDGLQRTGDENYGDYQFTSLEDIIYNFRVAYVGEDKIIPKISRADIKFHAMRGIQELSFDTFKSCKSFEIELPPSLMMILPQDYVNYIKLTWSDDSGIEHVIYPTSKTSNPLDVTQLATGDIRHNINGVLETDVITNPGQINSSTTWDNYSSQTTASDSDDLDWDDALGSRYGLDPQYAQQNGSFYINDCDGYIHFSSNLSGKTIILKYISDGLGTDAEMKVHKMAEEAMYKHIIHSILNTRANVDRNLVATFKKERSAAIRNAKLRLSNIKLEEITQILRGKSKWIKH
tara:strand:- start:732 stop:1643 length:912 start_codon:yes stop_codon:yes gene_type:complete